MQSSEGAVIEKKKQFPDTPEGWQRRWEAEINAAKKSAEKWHKRGDKVIARVLDERTDAATSTQTRVNLFAANVQTQRALLYGKTPQVDVKRRFADAGDDLARDAGEAMQRLLNTDIESGSDSYEEALAMALDDRLLAGLGNVRLRYECEEEDQDEVPAMNVACGCAMNGMGHPDPQCPSCQGTGQVEAAAAYTPPPKLISENVEVDYVYWKDQLWSPARNMHEVTWWAFRAEMTLDAAHARFDATMGRANVENLPRKGKDRYENSKVDGKLDSPWSVIEVWEIWDKSGREVFWWVKGASKILDRKDDILQLDGFFPFPTPMFANLTSSKLMPVPDFALAQDIYDEIDDVSDRITSLQTAINVRGVYDKTNKELKQLLSTVKGNQMIGVDSFGNFAEKGGLKGAVDWFPLDAVVAAMDKLREYRTELMALLYQVTGMSDIMRGQSSGTTTATEQAIKAKFASVRMQAFQNEFARFASETQALKAEIISKHYDVQTIIRNSNMEYMAGMDEERQQKVAALLKSDFLQFRVAVKPEAISMQDYAALKEERSAVLTAVATFLQSAMPVMQAQPMLTPMLFQVLQWSLAGFRGSSTVEAQIDQGVAMILADLKKKMAQQKAQMDQQKAQMDMAGKQQDLQLQGQKAQLELGVARQKAQVDITTAGIKHQQAKQDAELSIQQQEAQLQHDAVQGELDTEIQASKHEAEMAAIKAKKKEATSGGNQK
jgi:hypothetical protein